MALVKEAACPTCGLAHLVACSNFEYGRKGMLIRECRDCKADKVDAEIAKEKLAAQMLASHDDVFIWRQIMCASQLAVIAEQLFGHNRMPDYWRKVQRYINDHFSQP